MRHAVAAAAAIVAAVLCGCGNGQSARRIAVYSVNGHATPATLRMTATRLRDRASAMVGHPWTRVRGSTIELGGSGHPSRTALQDIGRPRKLRFYDWELNLVHPAPTRKKPRVQRGEVALQSEQPGPHGWYLLRDRPELTGADITKPAQGIDRFTHEPIVTFGFTPAGQAAFKRVTARLARRGAQIVPAPGQSRLDTFQHFAIALDDQIVSLAFVSYVDNPNGIDGRNGAQINGVGNLAQTRELAAELASGELPVALTLR